MKKILFVRPRHDDVVSYLYFYSDKLMKFASQKGFKVLNKEKDKAILKVVTNIIESNNPDFIMFNGHGSPSLICGHNNNIIIKDKVNNELLKNRIIYSLSCSSASKLGKNSADKNTAFIGYTDDFCLGMDVTCQASISRDKRAKLFLDPSNLLVESILKGNTSAEAVIKAKNMMVKNISILKTDCFLDADDYIPYLYHNFTVLEVFGNKEKKLS